MGSFRLTSLAFADWDPIPRRFGYREENVNPPLDIDGVPANAKSLVLLVDDPDVVEPAGKIWSHWVVWNIDPKATMIPEAWDASGAVQGTNDYGTRGYGGPNPPDKEHTYRFRLYALSGRLMLDEGAMKGEVEAAIAGSTLTEARLTGTYAP